MTIKVFRLCSLMVCVVMLLALVPAGLVSADAEDFYGPELLENAGFEAYSANTMPSGNTWRPYYSWETAFIEAVSKADYPDYVYEGNNLPEEFTCPLCGHGADDFEPIYENA